MRIRIRIDNPGIKETYRTGRPCTSILNGCFVKEESFFTVVGTQCCGSALFLDADPEPDPSRAFTHV
jgi:hypothetical protein